MRETLQARPKHFPPADRLALTSALSIIFCFCFSTSTLKTNVASMSSEDEDKVEQVVSERKGGSRQKHVVIIGAGAGGTCLAARLAHKGHKVTVVEKVRRQSLFVIAYVS